MPDPFIVLLSSAKPVACEYRFRHEDPAVAPNRRGASAPGFTLDFYSLNSCQIMEISVWSATFALASFFLGIRVYTVVHILGRFGLDDGRSGSRFSLKDLTNTEARTVLVLLAWLTDVCYFILLRICMRHSIRVFSFPY